MADLFIKMGVNAPSSDVDKQIVMQAYASDFSDGAIGVISSMTP